MFAEFNQKMHEVESAPLNERQRARAEWAEALKSPYLIAERAEWLLGGNYGEGAYNAAAEIMRHKRMNRAAWLGQAVAAYEWHCPPRFAREAWNRLTRAEQETITSLLNEVIARYEAESGQ